MPRMRYSVVKEEEFDTILEREVEFSGRIKTEKSLVIKGRVSGILVCGDDLFISNEAVVDADVRAPRITIRGAVSGTVRASESIQVLSGSFVDASLEAPEIYIEDEASFRGSAIRTAVEVPEGETAKDSDA